MQTSTPFAMKLKQFEIEFNEDATPAQYISHVSLTEAGRIVQQYSISVNHPLSYGGIKAYQSSFGYLVDLEGESNNGWKEQRVLGENGIFEIEGTDKALKIFKYIPNFEEEYGMETKNLRPDNPRIVFSTYEKGKLLSVGTAAFGEKVELEPGVLVTFKGIRPYTVLNVKRDPGLPLASAGGLMLMTGTCLALFLRPKKQGDNV
jgi:cytochrome c biogenesis protein